MHNSYWLHQTSRSSFGYCSLHTSLKMLGLIHALTYCFCTVACLLLLYFILLRLEYALPAWNIMTTNANKQECANVLYLWVIFSSHSLQLCCYTWAAAVTYCTSDEASIWCSFFFIICVFPRSKFYPSMIDNSSLQIPSCNVRNCT